MSWIWNRSKLGAAALGHNAAPRIEPEGRAFIRFGEGLSMPRDLAEALVFGFILVTGAIMVGSLVKTLVFG